MDKEQIRREWERGELIPPSVDIFEDQDNFILVANMPGVDKDGVEVKLAEGSLTLYGKVNRPQGPAERQVMREIDSGNYYRVFRVTDSIDVEKISARISEGVLIVTLPKHERIKPREIPIETA